MASSLPALCGQILVVGIEGRELTSRERRVLAAGERGGIVLFRRNIDVNAEPTMRKVAELVTAIRSALPESVMPLVAVDQEGGRVMRLGPPAMQLPPMRMLGDLGDYELIRRVAEAHARELAAIGFTMSFAPVADVHTREDNPIIGDRAFATTPERVARCAGTWAEGLARGGILSCAKHFPGHGDTSVDSHVALPHVSRSRADLEYVEIAAFRSLAKHPCVSSMMTAHVIYPALDPRQPATLSRVVCTDLLRHELGFDGVLFSDDLEMRALTMAVGEAATRAVAAGCDKVLVCSREDLADEAHVALIHEAEKSSAFRARCQQALARTQAMVLRHPLGRVAPVGDAELEDVFAASADITTELERRLAARFRPGSEGVA